MAGEPPLTVVPSPTDEEAAAIAAAVEALWPRPVGAAVEPVGARTTAWRFSGRWWHRDRLARAERPWS